MIDVDATTNEPDGTGSGDTGTTGTGTRPRTRSAILPDRDTLVDAALCLGLGLLAVVGLHHTFGGVGYLLVGGIAAAAGVVVAHLTQVLHPRTAVTVAAFPVAYLVFGGVAVPDAAIGGVLPGPGVPAALFEGLVHSWKGVLTTAAPMGLTGELGVVPYSLGFIAGAGGMTIARRTDWPLVAAAPALCTLVVSLLLGTRDPVSVIAQGSLFAAAAIAWGAIRSNRSRRSADGAVYWPRVVGGLVMLVAVVAAALPLGGVLPLAASAERYVVRDELVPPFDPRNEPSPLGAFRSFLRESGDDVAQAADVPLFEVQGLPDGAGLRLATMDAYDGVVWVVGGSETTGSGRFERVGSRIIPAPDGQAAEIEVTVLNDRPDVWVPSAGWTRVVRFEGPDAADLERSFRYNRLTGTAAVPRRLREGDRYVAEVNLIADHDDLDPELRADPSVVLPELPALEEVVAATADEIVRGHSGPLEQALALEAALQLGYYSDGGPGTEGTLRQSPSGHSLRRVNLLLTGDIMVGNAEQYASTMALMARTLGLPARVVIGFIPDEEAAASSDGAVTIVGEHAHAWVEIAFEDVGWVTFDPTPDKDREPDENPPPPVVIELPPPQDPPTPEYLQLPEDAAEVANDPTEPEEDDTDEAGGFPVVPRVVLLALAAVGIPVGLLVGVVGLVGGAKALRRRHRRTHGTATDRLSGAWREVCDAARDRGATVPPRVTRREAATLIGPEHWPGAPTVAGRVDELMFGEPDPDLEGVTALWGEVNRLRREALGQVGLVDRLRATANPASLRRLR